MEMLSFKVPGSENAVTQEAFNFLRTNIQFCGNSVKSIVITSSYENEGKSTVSLCLARNLADLDKKVLFIDADMRNSKSPERNFNAKDLTGLSEILSGQTDVNSCINKTVVPNLYVILPGTTPPNPTELLSKKLFSDLIQACKESFDYIILDSPPVALVTDATLISAVCDANILVVGRKSLSLTDLSKAADQLKKSGSKCLGIVRNFVPSSNGGLYSKYYHKK